MDNVFVIENSLLQDALGSLRSKDTPSDVFRFYSDRLSSILLSYVFAQLSVKDIEIMTPLTQTNSKQIAGNVVFLPILRAGLAMLSQALTLIPTAKVGFAGLVRDEKTAIASEYYWKMPSITETDTIYILDPMLATGGSICHVLTKLKQSGVANINIVSVIAAPEGISAIHTEFPTVTIFLAALDEKLNDEKYIIPGLGDFGDRYFGTEN